jgi:hypothetical protein
MTTIAFRVLMVGGDRVEVRYDGPDHVHSGRVIDHVVSSLAQDDGVIRCQHGEQLIVLFGRGVAAIEVTDPVVVPTA